MNTNSVVVRADGNQRIGFGHIMRCLAVGQELNTRGVEVSFLCADIDLSIRKFLEGENFAVNILDTEPASELDAELTSDILKQKAASWIILDGYVFNAKFQRALVLGRSKLLLFDDFAKEITEGVSLTVNPSPVSESNHVTEPDRHKCFLRGLNYFPIRKEYTNENSSNKRTLMKLLIALGGGDVDNINSVVLRSLAASGLDNIELILITGGENPHLKQLQQIALSSPLPITLLAGKFKIAEILADCDLAICGAGGSLWELASLGVPTISIGVANNQNANGVFAQQAGCSYYLGSSKQLSQETLIATVKKLLVSDVKRAELSAIGRKLVDGRGACRIVDTMLKAFSTETSD